MSLEEKIETVKGILDAIYIYLSLLEEKIDYKVESGYTGNSLYCKITQVTKKMDRIEYHLEYNTVVNVLRLEIYQPHNKVSKKYVKYIKENLQHKCIPNVQHLKTTHIYSFNYKYEDVFLVNSLAELMIAIDKSQKA